MTDPNYTALLIVLDRSGSMSGIRDDMVGGIQELIAAQTAQPGMLTIDVVTFDDHIEHTHAFAQPEHVQIELIPRGRTALYDAIGWSLTSFGQALAELPEHARPSTVLAVIVTDGHENASTEYQSTHVAKLVTQQRDEYDWDISFLGANQDAVLEARRIGIDPGDALTYTADVAGVTNANLALSRKLNDRRQGRRTEFTDDERGAAGQGEPQA